MISVSWSSSGCSIEAQIVEGDSDQVLGDVSWRRPLGMPHWTRWMLVEWFFKRCFKRIVKCPVQASTGLPQILYLALPQLLMTQMCWNNRSWISPLRKATIRGPSSTRSFISELVKLQHSKGIIGGSWNGRGTSLHDCTWQNSLTYSTVSQCLFPSLNGPKHCSLKQ